MCVPYKLQSLCFENEAIYIFAGGPQTDTLFKCHDDRDKATIRTSFCNMVLVLCLFL